MKAIQVREFGGPDVLMLCEVSDPVADEGQLVVRIKAIGVNPVDTYIRSGKHAVRPTLPYTPGSDGAGVIESVGRGVERFKPGDQVYVAGSLSGVYAEKALCLETQVFRLPDGASFEQGAAVGVPYATAYRGLFQRANARPGEVVLVHGASGGVGTAAVQLARAAGLTVIGTGGTDKGRELVASQGAHHVFDHRSAGYLSEIMNVTEGRGVDVILEMLANVNLANDLGLLVKRGRVVVIGNRGAIEIDPRAAMGKDSNILGMSLFNASEEERSSIHAALVAGLESGVLRPVIGQKMALADASQAHQAVLEPGAYGKIVLVP
jgi:NADPH2:quinone reductase